MSKSTSFSLYLTSLGATSLLLSPSQAAVIEFDSSAIYALNAAIPAFEQSFATP